MLINLINDMMDLAKSEQMKFDLNNEYFDFTVTVNRAMDNLTYLGNKKLIKQSCVIDPRLIPFLKNINADENRYTQILLNFLSNSFKFTPPNGSISVEVNPFGDEFFQLSGNIFDAIIY
jgi:signal transduction histidine kinase